MPLGKGLEFRAVAVIGCDDEVAPLQDRIETGGDESDLDEVRNSERSLRYVACPPGEGPAACDRRGANSEFLSGFRWGR